MLDPKIGKLIEEYDNRYQLVLDVASQARIIEKYNEDEIDSRMEKSVSLAIDKIAMQLESK